MRGSPPNVTGPPFEILGPFVLAAGESRKIAGPVLNILLLTATDTTNVQIGFDSSFQLMTFGIGYELPHVRDGFFLRNNSGAPNTITLMRGFARFRDSRIMNSGLPIPITSVDLGTQADAAATTDAVTFSYIALFKRFLSRFAPAANGAVIGGAGNPLLVAGSDGTNLRQLLTDATGKLQVAGSTGGTVDAAGAAAPGNPLKASYSQGDSPTPGGAGAYNIFALEAGATKTVRLRRITIFNPGAKTTAGLTGLYLIRTTAASTAGTVQAPQAHDSTDPAFSGVFRNQNPTVTTGAWTMSLVGLWVPTAMGPASPIVFDFDNGRSKPIVIQPGTANGICLQVSANPGWANVGMMTTWTEE